MVMMKTHLNYYNIIFVKVLFLFFILFDTYKYIRQVGKLWHYYPSLC